MKGFSRYLRAGIAAGATLTVASDFRASAGDPQVRTPVSKSSTARVSAPSYVSIKLEPAEIPLFGQRAEGRLVVTARASDGSLSDVTRRCTLSVSDPKVIVAGEGLTLRPVSDGQSTVKVRFGALSGSATVRVRDCSQRRPIDFSREVIPVLTHAGCNQGSCHGSQYGKGGFKLSLLGFEPDVDYVSLVKQAGGRRALSIDPTHSLMLLKPSLALPHQGGNRLEANSDDYKLLVAWLQDGAPGPTAKDAEVTKLEVFPSDRVLPAGESQTLIVRATYSDGVIRDVTRWARLQTLNDSIAVVSPSAVVKAGSRGETSIMVRFGGQATVARISVPFIQVAKFPEFPAANFVDQLVLKKWQALGLVPSGLCDDATFIRRASFDVIGTPPTPEEVKSFLADRAPDKRMKLVDRLLDRPEYADYWALKWGDLLRSERNKLGPKGMWSFSNWVRTQFRDNRPIDQFCRDLITAQGSTFTTGPANFYRVASNPPDLAETTAQVFLGTRLQCTKCHHHPFERWSQADYYKFAAFFARVGLKGSQEFGIFGNEQVVRLNQGGDVYHPKTNQLMKPTPLGGYPEFMRVKGVVAATPGAGGVQTADLVDPNPDASGDRRLALAEWITHDNILLARNIANRYWGYLMGRGLVEPIDDQRVTNPPTNPELLDALAKELMSQKYDLKMLIRTICTSRAYQLSSDVTKQNASDGTFYTHYFIRRMPAEVLLDSINTVTGTQEKFNSLPPGFRAIQLPDPQVESYFLDTFGRAPRAIACECERAAEPNMGQALHLMMGDLLNRKVQDGNGRVAKLISEKKTDAEIVETFFLTAFGRPPRADESSRALEQLRAIVDRPAMLPKEPVPYVHVQLALPRTQQAKDRDRKAVLEDILWALLNSKEFVFNH